MRQYLFFTLFPILLPIFIIAAIFLPIFLQNPYISSVKFSANISNSSDIYVEEIISIDSFSNYYRSDFREFEGNAIVEDINVYDTTENVPVQFELAQKDGKIKGVKWTFLTNGKSNRIVLSYRLKNAIALYSDVADFEWNYKISRKTGPGIRALSNMPEVIASYIEGARTDFKFYLPSAGIHAWSYPLKQRDIKIGNNTVDYGGQTGRFSSSVSLARGIDFRIAFPSGIMAGNKIDAEGLSKIENEEKIIGITRPLVKFAAPVLIAILLFLLVYFAVGREYKTEGYEAVYERDIPYDYSPAIVSALVNQDTKEPKQEDFIAVILNLSTKGYLKFQREKNDYEITFINKDISALARHEQHAIEILKEYSTNGKLSFNFLKGLIEKDQTAFRIMFREWQGNVKKEAVGMNFFSAAPAIRLLFYIFCFGFLIYGMGLGPFSLMIRDTVLFLGILCAIILVFAMNIIFRQALPKRTRNGSLHYARWMNFKKFLEDFSELKRHPPESIVVWERYLAYALSLGVADTVKKTMSLSKKTKVPPVI